MKKPLLLLSLLLIVLTSSSQWTHRYCKVEGFNHHVYLEGFELPVMNAGAIDPAPSPDGKQVVFASKGYLWLMDISSGKATRITSSPYIDSNPNWSPHGAQIVFVRDEGNDTKIMLIDVASANEKELVNTKALELDPIFSLDGESVLYSSAEDGSLDVWSISISDGSKNKLLESKELERLPIEVSNQEFLYLNKEGFSTDAITLHNSSTGNGEDILIDNFTSQVSYSLSPDHRTMAFVYPHINDYELRLKDIRTPGSIMMLTKGQGLPLSPKFSYDGQWIYFYENTASERAQIKRISVNGGREEVLPVSSWDWAEETALVKLNTTVEGKKATLRLSITDAKGHPIIPETSAVRTDGQNGDVFFYCPESIEFRAPLGEITIKATQGFETKPFEQTFTVNKGKKLINIGLERIWDASAANWYSGDIHFHLNYGGVYHLDPQDILPDLRGEALDIGFPLLANLHNRFLEQYLWGWKNTNPPLIRFGQEVRSHFLGHLGVIGTEELFWPWVWGPYYDVYGRDDRTNAEALDHAHKYGGLGSYVHPVSIRNPLTPEGAGRIPIELVADCVLGKADLIELGCLWTDEIGTGSLWHQILNLGVPLSISGGSDVMNDYYRTMAVGASRAYVKCENGFNENDFLQGLKDGKSFVSTGPMLEFELSGKEPGEAIADSKSSARFTLNVHAPIAFEKVEIFVNGKVAWTKKGNSEIGSKSFKGRIKIPKGGWVTARVSGGESAWPLMESYPFAETSPVWIGKKGSFDPLARQAAAEVLLMILDVSEQDLKTGYAETEIPKLLKHFTEARLFLEKISRQ